MSAELDERGRVLCLNPDCDRVIPIEAEAGYTCPCGRKAYFIPPRCADCETYLTRGTSEGDPCPLCGSTNHT